LGVARVGLKGFNSFHFLHPFWLLGLPALWTLAAGFAWQRRRGGGWAQLVDPALLGALRLGGAQRTSSPWLPIVAVWTLAALALAGPAWERAPSRAYRAPENWVVVLDLSPSMNVGDVPPDRATRARYAIDDILSAARDARVGLVAFAGEAHVVVPLTTDAATVRALLQPLAPSIMPETGDELAPALLAAARLLHEAGSRNGKVIVLTDGYADPEAAAAAAEMLAKQGVGFDVLGIGTPQGGPAVNPGGAFVQNAQGGSVLVKLPVEELQHLAQVGGGRYWSLGDLSALLASLHGGVENPFEENAIATKIEVGEWRNEGIWLLPPLLLFAALYARRGWL
jgi:Ca-activated chloride channel family protein